MTTYTWDMTRLAAHPSGPDEPGVTVAVIDSDGPPVWAVPQALPFRAVLAGGSTLTSLADLPAETLTGMGFVPADPAPAYDPATHRAPRWDAVAAGWVIEPIPLEEIAAALADEAAALQQQVADAVQQHLDAAVQARNYDSMATCVTYAGEASVPRFQQEGRAARAWRSAVWERCYAVLAEVLAGERAPLTPTEMIAELPLLVWPD